MKLDARLDGRERTLHLAVTCYSSVGVAEKEHAEMCSEMQAPPLLASSQFWFPTLMHRRPPYKKTPAKSVRQRWACSRDRRYSSLLGRSWRLSDIVCYAEGDKSNRRSVDV